MEYSPLVPNVDGSADMGIVGVKGGGGRRKLDRKAPGMGGVQAGEAGCAKRFGVDIPPVKTCFIGVLCPCVEEELGDEDAEEGVDRSWACFNRVRSLFSTLSTAFPFPLSSGAAVKTGSSSRDVSASASEMIDVSPEGRQTYPSIRRMVVGGTIETTVESPSSISLIGVEGTFSLR